MTYFMDGSLFSLLRKAPTESMRKPCPSRLNKSSIRGDQCATDHKEKRQQERNRCSAYRTSCLIRLSCQSMGLMTSSVSSLNGHSTTHTRLQTVYYVAVNQCAVLRAD